jgi:hypothetical protein
MSKDVAIKDWAKEIDAYVRDRRQRELRGRKLSHTRMGANEYEGVLRKLLKRNTGLRAAA